VKLRAFLALSMVLAGGAPALAASAPAGTYTFHYDNGRTGWNPNEKTLTVATVSSTKFGLLGTLATDSVVFAEPLFVPGVSVGGKTHDIVLVATEADTAYAFDAQTGAQLWKHSYLSGNQVPQPIESVQNCTQIFPKIGVSSTPVVDVANQSLYAVAKFYDPKDKTYHAQLRSLDLSTGAENRPAAEIGGSVLLNNGNGAKHTFTAQWQQQRAALLLDNGVIYIGFGSSCDLHAEFVTGWLFAYDESTMKRVGFISTAPDYLGASGYYMDSIWQGTFGPAADENGDLFLATGNGNFDANTKGGENYGDAVLRLATNLAVKDYFTPYNEAYLEQNDLDVGSAGVMLIPGQFTGAHHLAVAGGKNGVIFLLNRDNLGGFTPKGPDKVLQEISGPTVSLFDGPALYGTTVYYGFAGQPLTAYGLSLSPKPKLTPTSVTAAALGDVTPSISSDGVQAGTAVLWTTDRVGYRSSLTLYAYDATDLSHLLFTGTAGEWKAESGALVTPTIGDGRVFVPGAGDGVAVFGLKGTARNSLPARR